jgi:hypothetical protein
LLLPFHRVAAGVKTGNDQWSFAFHNKKQAIGKVAQQGTPHVPENDRKLARI